MKDDNIKRKVLWNPPVTFWEITWMKLLVTFDNYQLYKWTKQKKEKGFGFKYSYQTKHCLIMNLSENNISFFGGYQTKIVSFPFKNQKYSKIQGILTSYYNKKTFYAGLCKWLYKSTSSNLIKRIMFKNRRALSNTNLHKNWDQYYSYAQHATESKNYQTEKKKLFLTLDIMTFWKWRHSTSHQLLIGCVLMTH